MRKLRRIHLYLGVVFAPMIIYFALSGAWQTLELHDSDDDAPSAFADFLHSISQIHEHQRLQLGDEKPSPSIPLRWFFVLMSIGLMVTSVLGVVLALRFIDEAWKVWASLAVGLILPIVLLFLGGGT